jgi:hypothetical protein
MHDTSVEDGNYEHPVIKKNKRVDTLRKMPRAWRRTSSNKWCGKAKRKDEHRDGE